MVNDVELGEASIEDFFSKYGNCDGHNVVGLIAEAYFVRELWKAGYDVMFVFSHNIEVRKIRKNNFVYECVRDYGEVVEHMPGELKRKVEKFCEKGIHIVVIDDGNIPVFLEGKLLFKTSIRKILRCIITRSKRIHFPFSSIFDSEFAPLLLALGEKICIMLSYRDSVDVSDGKLYLENIEVSPDGIREFKRTEIKNCDEILDKLEEIFEKNAICLRRNWETGLEISNRKIIEEESKLLKPLIKAWS